VVGPWPRLPAPVHRRSRRYPLRTLTPPDQKRIDRSRQFRIISRQSWGSALKFASARTLSALFAYLETIGVSPHEVADAAAIAFARGAAASDRIPVGLTTDVLEQCAVRLGDPLFGLKYAQGADPRILGPISLFWRYAPTLRYSNAFSARVLHMHYEGFAVVLDVDGGEASFVQQMDGDLRRAGRQFVEANLSFSLRLCRWILGTDWSPLRIALAHPPSCDPADYVDVLRAPVLFGAEEDALVVRTSDLDRKSDGHDPELLEFVERSLIAQADEQPLQFGQRLARTIDTLLAMKSAKLATAASALGMSPRSLQRRLTEAGTSFQAVLAERRHAIIEAASAGGRRAPLAVLAERTGYSDPSAVSRFIRLRG
jgi:AraC-like DNA-binding protein